MRCWITEIPCLCPVPLQRRLKFPGENIGWIKWKEKNWNDQRLFFDLSRLVHYPDDRRHDGKPYRVPFFKKEAAVYFRYLRNLGSSFQFRASAGWRRITADALLPLYNFHTGYHPDILGCPSRRKRTMALACSPFLLFVKRTVQCINLSKKRNGFISEWCCNLFSHWQNRKQVVHYRTQKHI